MYKLERIVTQELGAMVALVRLFKEFSNPLGFPLLGGGHIFGLSKPLGCAYKKVMAVWLLLFFNLSSQGLSHAQTPPAPAPTDTPLAKDLYKEREKTRHFEAPPPVHPPEEALHGFGCERKFSCAGNDFHADSNHRIDGEMLRDYLKQYPEAISELNAYQATRRTIRVASYIGTLGVLIALGGLIASTQLTGSEQIVIRNVFTATGLGLTLASTAATFLVLNINEARLDRAVSIYNRGNPDRQIVLQFKSQLDL